MEEIIQILMRRDGISREEASRQFDGCIEAIMECLDGDGVSNNLYEDAAETIYDYLGLEPDYLEIILNEL